MSRRESPESQITTFFQTATAENAIAMDTAVKSILLSRGFELDGRKTAQKKSKEPKGAGKKTATPPIILPAGENYSQRVVPVVDSKMA